MLVDQRKDPLQGLPELHLKAEEVAVIREGVACRLVGHNAAVSGY